MAADWYRVLGVIPGAPHDTIRRQYRRLAARCHPDLYAGDPALREAAERRMKAINAAYEVLKDPSRRAAYDAERARRLAPPPAPRLDRLPYPGPLRPRARPRRRARGGLAGWVIGLVALGLAACWPPLRGAMAPGSYRAASLPAFAADPRDPAAVVERFVAAYHAGDIAGAAAMLDPESVYIVVVGEGPRGPVCYECSDADRRMVAGLLAAGFEVRRRGGLPAGVDCPRPLKGEARQSSRAVLHCLGGLAGGVEFHRLWAPAGPTAPPIASASGRFVVVSPARRKIEGQATLTLRRRPEGWRISAIALRAPAW